MRVLLVVDFSTVSERTVKGCAEQTWPAGATVRVLGVAEKIPPSAAELWFDAAGSLETVMRTRAERVEELVREAAGVLRASGLATETSVRTGRRRKAIALETRSWHPDKVIDAARGMR